MVMDSLFGELIGGDGKKRKGAIAEFITPFVTESIGTERITDILPIGRRGKTRNGRTIYSSLDSADDILGKSLVHVLGGLTPWGCNLCTKSMARCYRYVYRLWYTKRWSSRVGSLNVRNEDGRIKTSCKYAFYFNFF
jgi:hypothetical protein